MVRKKEVKKVKKGEKKEIRCGRMIVKDGTIVGASPQEADEIIHGLGDGKPWVRKKALNRRGFDQDVPIMERFLKIVNKGTLRGKACQLLVKEGLLTREEYKQFNRWGDTRFMEDFVTEELRGGYPVYVLKSELAEGMRKLKG